MASGRLAGKNAVVTGAAGYARSPSSPFLERLCSPVTDVLLTSCLDSNSGIGLETCILFAKEGANVLMSDISTEALEKALAKVKQLVPNAGRVEVMVRSIPTGGFPTLYDIR